MKRDENGRNKKKEKLKSLVRKKNEYSIRCIERKTEFKRRKTDMKGETWKQEGVQKKSSKKVETD
jgi:hypothetical protein